MGRTDGGATTKRARLSSCQSRNTPGLRPGLETVANQLGRPKRQPNRNLNASLYWRPKQDGATPDTRGTSEDRELTSHADPY